MTTFSQRIWASDVITAPFEAIWEYYATTAHLAALTPLVERVTATPLPEPVPVGDQMASERWSWQLVGVSALGVNAAPSFTTLMDPHDHGIRFWPDPLADDRASAVGSLRVDPLDDSRTRLSIDLVASVDLPLPSLMSKPVGRVMMRTMKLGGTRFADNLIGALGHPPRRGLRVSDTPEALAPGQQQDEDR